MPARFDGQLELHDGWAAFRPKAQASFAACTELLASAVEEARRMGVRLLLLDTRKLGGFASPTLSERWGFSRRLAEAARGDMAIAVVARPDHIDPRRFGVVVGANAGLRTAIFPSEAEAFDWLLRFTGQTA